MRKQTCDNCYNWVCPTVGVLFPHYKCLADDSEFGGEDTTKFQEKNGLDCPHWHEAMKVTRH